MYDPTVANIFTIIPFPQNSTFYINTHFYITNDTTMLNMIFKYTFTQFNLIKINLLLPNIFKKIKIYLCKTCKQTDSCIWNV